VWLATAQYEIGAILAARAWEGDAERAHPLLEASIEASREIGATVLLGKAERTLARVM
jgi:hypothetical protein